MTVHLDHMLVPAHDKLGSARLLAEILGVPWSEHGGRIVYWNEPGGHYREMLTESYARQPREEKDR